MAEIIEIEHDPWLGPQYCSGIDGQRIALVGYSHHRDPCDEDTSFFTLGVISDVIEKDRPTLPAAEAKKIQFFRSIRGYFGFEDVRDFWNRVLFFNFLPDCIGVSDHRYDIGSKQQIKRAQNRVTRLLCKHRPHKTLVFTRKGWDEFPRTREEVALKTSPTLTSASGRFTWGTYDCDGFFGAAYGLRHPQGAPRDMIRRTVQDILALPIVDA